MNHITSPAAGADGRRRIRRLLLLPLALAAAGVLFFWCQQNVIQTEVIEVTDARLPAAFDGLRVAIVSDVHGKEFGADSAVLLAKTARLTPDLIAITGDLVHRRDQLEMVPALAAGLSAIAPTYYVTGNHEWAAKLAPEVKDLLEQEGVTVLSNSFLPLEREGQRIVLAGVDDPNGPYDQKTPVQVSGEIKAAWGDVFTLLLAHRNDHCEAYDQAGFHLILSGHAHGGVVRLPFTDGLIGPNMRLFPSRTAGYYALEQGQLVVSRGLGISAEPFRLFNRPHLPVVILRAADSI